MKHPLACLLLFLCCVSCSPVKRMARIAANNPGAAAIVCNNAFPIRESVEVRTRTVTDTQTLPGSVVYVDCDTVAPKTSNSYGSQTSNITGKQTSKIVRVPCPPAQIIITTIHDSVITVQESTAALTALTNERNAARIEAAKYKAERNLYMWIAIGLSALIAVRIILRIWLKI